MQSKIEQQVMASVGVVYGARQLVSATAIKLYVCALALYGLGRLVWVSRVFENLANVGWGQAAEFMLSAVMSTDLLVQVVLMVLAVAGISLIRDLVRSSGASNAAFA